MALLFVILFRFLCLPQITTLTTAEQYIFASFSRVMKGIKCRRVMRQARLSEKTNKSMPDTVKLQTLANTCQSQGKVHCYVFLQYIRLVRMTTFELFLRTYTRRDKFFLLMNMITIIWLHFNPEQCISIILTSKHNNVLPHRYTKHHSLQHALPGKGYRPNCEFTIFTFVTLFGAFCTLAFCSTPAIRECTA